MLRRPLVCIFLVVFSAFSSFGVIAEEKLPIPAGEVLLIINGNISRYNVGETAQFDLEMLQKLETTSFKTATQWTEGITEFTGVRVNELLNFVGAGSTEFRALALDKYYNDVYDIDFDKIPAIIAYKKNGEAMSVRELGPLWLMFPFDEYSKLNDEKHRNASVWQLIELVIK